MVEGYESSRLRMALIDSPDILSYDCNYFFGFCRGDRAEIILCCCLQETNGVSSFKDPSQDPLISTHHLLDVSMVS